MSIFTDADRAFLKEMCAITTNSLGQEILVGLTVEETEFYMKFSNQTNSTNFSDKDKERYLELNQKHEFARLGVLAGENQLKNDNPKLH